MKTELRVVLALLVCLGLAVRVEADVLLVDDFAEGDFVSSLEDFPDGSGDPTFYDDGSESYEQTGLNTISGDRITLANAGTAGSGSITASVSSGVFQVASTNSQTGLVLLDYESGGVTLLDLGGASFLNLYFDDVTSAGMSVQVTVYGDANLGDSDPDNDYDSFDVFSSTVSASGSQVLSLALAWENVDPSSVLALAIQFGNGITTLGFTLDKVEFDAVPEVATWEYVAAGLLLLAGLRLWGRRGRGNTVSVGVRS